MIFEQRLRVALRLVEKQTTRGKGRDGEVRSVIKGKGKV